MRRKRIELKDQYDLNELMSDMFDDFLRDFPRREGLTIPPDNDDYEHFDYTLNFVYTQKGMDLIERYRKRMFDLYSKYWNELDFNMKSTLFTNK